MKKCFLSLTMVAGLLFGTMTATCAETSVNDTTEQTTEVISDSSSATNEVATIDSATAATVASSEEQTPKAEETKVEEATAPVVAKASFHQIVKEKIIEGGVLFMSIVLFCLIIGLTIAVERVITLNLASTNVKKLLDKVKQSIQLTGVNGAKEVCAQTSGPVASILAQGLIRVPAGLDNVKESIESHGSAEMMRLEKGMSWVSLFISLAPMFGFMGTVIGMIDAFDTIQMAEDIKIDQVAGGIKTALLTTVAGLIVAVILQVFYNYLTAKLDSLAEQMEDANNSFIDILIVSDVLNNANTKPSDNTPKDNNKLKPALV